MYVTLSTTEMSILKRTYLDSDSVWSSSTLLAFEFPQKKYLIGYQGGLLQDFYSLQAVNYIFK